MENKLDELIKKRAQFVVDLTGFGSALHVNDILPDFLEIVEKARDSERNRIFAILRHLNVDHDAAAIMETYDNWHKATPSHEATK